MYTEHTMLTCTSSSFYHNVNEDWLLTSMTLSDNYNFLYSNLGSRFRPDETGEMVPIKRDGKSFASGGRYFHKC